MSNYIWLSLIILFAIVEALTPAIVSIWFALGALLALVASALSAPVWLQITVFIIASALALILTRPLIKRKLNKTLIPTNADMLIGKTGVVVEKIDNIEETGSVKIQGKTWTARSEYGEEILSGSRVVISKIEGVKLIVKLLNKSL
ncbi:MAG: NfeD family protein [Ruminococcaceae bacterium]|nr:NfeD family protein [Oscillospiraceae bacterium]MBQ7120023.1 NfeD family protein [Oscillospiraceae bacterium]